VCAASSLVVGYKESPEKEKFLAENPTVHIVVYRILLTSTWLPEKRLFSGQH
jgi:hypothetical protein